MLDLTRPITTRSGAAVRVICTDSRARSGPLAVLITDGVRELLRSYPITGECAGAYGTATVNRSFDLINARAKVKRWRVTYAINPALQRVPMLYTSSIQAIDSNSSRGWLTSDVVSIALVDVYEDELP